MATYAEGFRHAHGCPHGEVEDGLAGGKPTREGVDEFEWDSEGDAENAFSGGSGGRAARKVCQDRRCCTWFDLANWFGFLPLELPLADFEACFTDVASGGIGLYEKLIVLGGKTLSLMAEMHFYELFSTAKGDVYLPASLAGVEVESLRLIWASVRAERVCGPQGLFLFGRSYLATAQTLSTRQAVAKYVKACIGYGCQNNDTENIYRWMPVLVEHIFWIQKLRTEKSSEDNALLQDLQEYLGYKYDHLLPRIRECLENPAVPQRSDVPTGRELLRLYATDYFTSLAEMSSVPPRERPLWVEEEVAHFLSSPAVAVFASMAFALGPFLSTTDSDGPPTAQDFVSTFESLVAACWIISTEERVKVWMPALIQRLRQVQLTLHMSKLGDKYFSRGEALRRPRETPVDVKDMAKANKGFLDRFRLWNVDPTRRPLSEHPVVYPPACVSSFPGVQINCEVPCCLPQRASQPKPSPSTLANSLPPNKVLYLVDAVDRRFEFYPLGPQPLPTPTRRRTPSARASAAKTHASKESSCFFTPKTGEACGSNCAAPSRSPSESKTQKATAAPPSSILPRGRSLPPLFAAGPGMAGLVPPLRQADEPKLRIRYATDDGDSAGDVEVFVDDVLVHRQTIPDGAKNSEADFKAVLSVPNSRPVVLNFVRSGDDGRPTLYVTDERRRGERVFSKTSCPHQRTCGAEQGEFTGGVGGAAGQDCCFSENSGGSLGGSAPAAPSRGCCWGEARGASLVADKPSPETASYLGAVDIQMRPIDVPAPSAFTASSSPPRVFYSTPIADNSDPVGCGWTGLGCYSTPSVASSLPTTLGAAAGPSVVPRIRAFTKRSQRQAA